METRIRMGFKPSATKGTVSIDVTAEASSPEETALLLREGINQFRIVAAEEGFVVNEGGKNHE